MRYVTHPYLDLDAVASLAVLGAAPADVAFVPAAAAFPADPDVRVVDHPAGEKGRLDDDGNRHAALLSLPEAADLDGSDLLAEVDEQDATGTSTPRHSLARILGGVRAILRDEEGLTGSDLDRAIYAALRPVIRGLARQVRDRRAAEREADSVRTVTIGPYRFAVDDGGGFGPMTGIVLAERGVTGLVFRDGPNLGVTRYPGLVKPDLRRPAPALPGWFIHPAGFLACWGSRKSPAPGPPPVGTPQDVEALLTMLRAAFDLDRGRAMARS
jgi:hypothetical protein